MSSRTSQRSSLLRSIRNTASELKSRWPYNQASRPHRGTLVSTPASNFDAILPQPDSLVPELEALGIDANTAEMFSTAYIKAATCLKDRCESLLRKRHQVSDSQGSSDASRLLEHTLSCQYRAALDRWKTSVLQTTHAVKSSRNAGKQRAPFNQSSLSLLERYWDYNAYPTTADRAILSNKTGLTLRQIEVWFQNHRNRARKLGITRTRHELDCFPWGEDEVQLTGQNCDKLPVRSTAPSTNLVLKSGQLTPKKDKNILDRKYRSAYSFPSPFTSSSNVSREFKFSPVQWYRYPACEPKTSSISNIPSDVDELCQAFRTRLNLRQSAATSGETSQLWSPPTYFALHPRRHPAFLTKGHTDLKPSNNRSKLSYQTVTPSERSDAFLRYQHQAATFTEAIIADPSLSITRSLRRSSSASSTDNSSGCPTPDSSPTIPSINLSTDSRESPYVQSIFENPYQTTSCDWTSGWFFPRFH